MDQSGNLEGEEAGGDAYAFLHRQTDALEVEYGNQDKLLQNAAKAEGPLPLACD